MNDTPPEFDPTLAARFHDAHTHIAEQPFVGAMLKRVAQQRVRSATVRRTVQATAFVAVIGASPWLIQGSMLLSNKLDQVFALASTWLAQPAGIAVVAIAAVAAIALAWSTRVFR